MKNRKNPGIMRFLVPYFKDEKSKTAAVAVFALAGSILTLYAPTILGAAIDQIAPGATDFSGISARILTLGAVYAGGAVFTWISAVFAARLAASITCKLRRNAFARLSSLPLSVLDKTQRGDILTRFAGDSDLIFDGISQLLIQVFSAGITLIFALIFMIRMNLVISLVVCAGAPLIFAVARFVSGRSGALFRRQQELLGELGGFAEEQIRGLDDVQAFCCESENIRRFSAINAELYGVGQKAQFFSSLTNPTSRFVNYLSYISVGLAGGILALNQDLSVGMVVAFLTYSTIFSKPFNEISALSTQIFSVIAALRRIISLINETPEPPEPDYPLLNKIRGNIKFENVEFSYSEERTLIHNFNLEIKSGDTVAIVGPTGAGKTTIVSLLMRFYEVSGGRITLDGRDILSIRREDLRRGFGMVLQDAWLFPGTIRENIAFGCPGATDEDIIKAAKSARVHGFIKRLPNGYETVLERGGAGLSDGQRQLITIARAMLSDPPMLILDEATSSVDSLTEHRIQKSFYRIMEGKTSFVIAHRMSTIRGADVIIVMKDGGVIQQGTHEELMNSAGFYRDLNKN